MSEKTHPRARKGMFVHSQRWAKEGFVLRRLFPKFFAGAEYFILGRVRAKRYNQAMSSFNNAATPPLFRQVEMETLNRCNGTCAFCPVNCHAPQRPLTKMTEELFENIIGQLAALNYSGNLSLYSNNEPLLDTRLPQFAAFARAHLPKARMILYTNGTLLTVDKFREFMPYFDKLTINNYNTSPEMLPSIQAVHDYCLTAEGETLIADKTLNIQFRDPNAILSSRGGYAPNCEAPTEPVSAKCMYPFQQLVIRPDGRTSLCCNDALGKMTLGDLSTTPILEVWQGKAYANIRKHMAETGRRHIPLCAACDYVTL